MIYNECMGREFSEIKKYHDIAFSEICQRLQEVPSSSLPWLVAKRGGKIVGYAYASRWKGRCAYRFSTEVIVYVAPVHTGHGIGSMLYCRTDSGVACQS